MNAIPDQTTNEAFYRRILGVRFFVGSALEAVDIGMRPGLVVVPAAPALMEIANDREYRQALLEADLAITDSGFMVLLWNVLRGDNIRRVSGLEYIKNLLSRPELREPGAVVWVMPSERAMHQNLRWLKAQGYPTEVKDCCVAPKYGAGPIVDDNLVNLLRERKPRHVIIGLGGGVQEKLGLFIRRQFSPSPAIHCIGAAIGFLSGEQVRIPDWADQWILGWLFRCAANPKRFIPRYAKALRLAIIIWRYHDRLPELNAVSSAVRN